MTPTIIDSDTGRTLWRTKDCAGHCSLKIRSWSSYVNTGHAPKPVAHLDLRSPLWDAEEVRAWQSARPSQRS